MVSSIKDTMCILYWRWQDEKEFEDFQDYQGVMKRELEKNLDNGKFLSATKRPFTFTFSLDNKTYKVAVNSSSYSWSRLS